MYVHVCKTVVCLTVLEQYLVGASLASRDRLSLANRLYTVAITTHVRVLMIKCTFFISIGNSYDVKRSHFGLSQAKFNHGRH